jgi:peptidoglycan lytic transglycosylase G
VARPPAYEPQRRRPDSPGSRTIAARRVVALLVVGGVVAGVVWLGVAVADGIGGGNSKPKPVTTRAVPVPRRPFRVIFPEGFTRRQMAQRVQAVAGIAERERGRRVRLSASTYLVATRVPRRIAGFGARRYPLEGFLFPSAYDFGRLTTSGQLVAKQLGAFHEEWSSVNLSYARSKNLTPYDVLTIASMIEKEAVAPEERAKISAVIYNRLHAGMTLGIDATIRYGLNIPPTKSILESQLQSSNPYNTRRFHGLPPTPIANPGLASIQAAAHPAHVNYLYFVRTPDHVHHFFTASASAFDAYARAHGY